MARILVGGGAGFIGSHIADAYLKASYSVSVLDDLSTGNRANLEKAELLHTLSITDPNLSALILQEAPEIINHHAAQVDVRVSVADPCRDAAINIMGSLNLLEAAREAKVKKVIFASSGGAIYGEQDYYPADEKHPEKAVNPYGIGKYTVERTLAFYQREFGIDYVALRYANVYGPRQNTRGEASVVAAFCRNILRGEPPIIYGDGEQTRDLVFIDDVVACNTQALRPEVRGSYNVGTGIETTINTLASELIKISGKRLKPHHAPARPGEQKRSSLTPGLLQTSPPTPLAEGLTATYEWFATHP